MSVFDGQIDVFDLLTALQPAPEPQPVGDVGTFLHPGDLEAMYDAKIAHHR